MDEHEIAEHTKTDGDTTLHLAALDSLKTHTLTIPVENGGERVF